MIPELGTLTLALAMITAAVMGVIGLRPKMLARQADLMRALASAQFMALTLAFAAVLVVFITSDFSVDTVHKNSHRLKPMLYKITGAWGNHEGSILMWALIGAGYTYAFSRFAGPRMNTRIFSTTMGVLGLLGAGIAAYILFLSSPLARIDLLPGESYPLEGTGLNPLLQDFGLAIHPPVLYFGFLGLIIPYALAISYLTHRGEGKDFSRQALPWTTLSFAFLSAGIMLGSWWAYRELGWGGWWFWDPVENASLIPWFLAAALAHSLAALRTRNVLLNWSLFLAISGYSASILAAFLVRSGVLVSVHAFAADPKRGAAILLYLVVMLIGAFAVYAFRARRDLPPGQYNLISREGAVLSHNLLGAAAALTVVIGTLYPVIIQALDMPLLSVGEPYFHASVIPLMVLATYAMTVGPEAPWRGAAGKVLWSKIILALSVAVTSFIASWLVFDISFIGAACIGGGVGILVTHVKLGVKARKSPSARKLAPMIIAHIGVGLFAIAGAGSIVFAKAGDRAIAVGESKDIVGFNVTLDSLTEGQGPNYFTAIGGVTIIKPSGKSVQLEPEFRYYPVSDMPTSEAAIDSNLLRDVYVTINSIERNEGEVLRWAVRIQYRPFILLLWISSAITVFGILWAAFNQFAALPKRRAALAPALKPLVQNKKDAVKA